MARHQAGVVTRYTATIRFVQGYRYLDRCGDALIRLEDHLGEGWLTGEVSPKSGQFSCPRLGIRAGFSSELVQVLQDEFLSLEHFRNAVCTIFEVLRGAFEIQRIVSPCMEVILQTGFDDSAEADAYIRDLEIVTPSGFVLSQLGGDIETVSPIMTTTQNVTWQNEAVSRRRRLAVQGIRQEKRSAFDSRILQRINLLPMFQHPAIKDILEIRRTHPEYPRCAAQFSLETTLEGEFTAARFDMPRFVDDTTSWVEQFRRWVRER